MANILLFTDTHFTDNSIDSYRWIFIEEQLPKLIVENNVSHIFGLGDIVDRRDRHSAIFINRLVNALLNLKKLGASIHLLMGNHDAPVNGIPYWTFLNALGIDYITQPQNLGGGILCLPFSPNPVGEWKDINLSSFKMILMHQTLAGALIEGERKIEKDNAPMPLLPRGIPIYSGDVHRPQILGPVNYIGLPYPTRFGETWKGRCVLVNELDFKDFKEIKLNCIERAIIDLNADNLATFGGRLTTLGKGDQVRVRFNLAINDLVNWPTHEKDIRFMAEQIGVTLLSVEPIFTEVVSSDNKTIANNTALEALSKDDTLRLFAKEENLPDEILEVGLELVRLSSI